MPIYEFYCESCNTIYNFFSRSVNTTKKPSCPTCKTRKLKRQMSRFANIGVGKEEDTTQDLPVDESRMEKALDVLSREAAGINGEDPQQAAKLMRKFTDAAGANLGSGMEEALRRMEAGEDPDRVESEMGDLIDNEEPFLFDEKSRPATKTKRTRPKKDHALYDL